MQNKFKCSICQPFPLAKSIMESENSKIACGCVQRNRIPVHPTDSTAPATWQWTVPRPRLYGRVSQASPIKGHMGMHEVLIYLGKLDELDHFTNVCIYITWVDKETERDRGTMDKSLQSKQAFWKKALKPCQKFTMLILSTFGVTPMQA